MTFRLLALVPVVLLAAAAPAHAQLYKWVDAKGVTNYSSTPPSGPVTKATVLSEDRLSVIPQDPTLAEAAAASAARSAQAQASADAEWLQRQRLMALKDSYTTVAYADDYYYPNYPYYYATYPVARARAAHAVASRPHAAPRGAVVRASSRGALVR